MYDQKDIVCGCIPPKRGLELPNKKDGVARRTFQGLKKRFWYHLECSTSKGPQRVGALYFVLGYWAEKIIVAGGNVLF